MAGEPKPWVMRLKWVRQPWIPGSIMGAGREFPSGERSCVSRSVNSLQICLRGEKKKFIVANGMLTEYFLLDFISARFHHLLGCQEHILARVDFVALYM